MYLDIVYLTILVIAVSIGTIVGIYVAPKKKKR